MSAGWGPLRDFCIFEERIRQNVENVAALRAVLWRRLTQRAALLLLLLGALWRAGVSGWRLPLGAGSARLAAALPAILLACSVAALGSAVHAGLAWRRAVAGAQYEAQCHRSLAPFAMQLRLLPAGGPAQSASLFGRLAAGARRMLLLQPRTVASGEITFVRRLPRPLALFLEAYRAEYRARRALRAQPLAAKKGR